MEFFKYGISSHYDIPIPAEKNSKGNSGMHDANID